MMSNAVLTLLLLVCKSALWVANASNVGAPIPECDFMLEIPSVNFSLTDMNSISLPPWSGSTTTVKDRIPSTIWEAECSSTPCSAPNSGLTGEHDLNSVPIYQNMLVLNRKEGTRCYVASYQSVAVGCTCVRATHWDQV